MGRVATPAFAFALLLVAVADIPEGVRTWQPWTAMSAVLAAVAWVSRHRTRPSGAIAALLSLGAVGVGAQVWGEAGQIPVGHQIVLALLLADVAYHQSARTTSAVVAVAVAAVVGVLAEALADARGPSDVAFVLALWGLAVAAALAVRWWRQATAARVEHARAAERERLARDLHDAVAHHVSGIALTAAGARTLVDTDPQAVDDSLAKIHGAAATTLDEMRQIVQLLRHDDRDHVIGDLAELADVLADTGSPEVDVAIHDDLGRPPATTVGAVFRIAQEAVTNSRRHARQVSRIDIDVRRDGPDLVLRVTDDGSGVRGRRAGVGYGLRGMRERAELLGGSCVAGPSADGGWAVEARIPAEGRP